jgi:hypothetical protein
MLGHGSSLTGRPASATSRYPPVCRFAATGANGNRAAAGWFIAANQIGFVS